MAHHVPPAGAEDLPDASFAGQQETFLNVQGIEAILQSIREVYASLYNDRAISYRVHHGFAHADVGISAGVQKMVRSDVGASGVMFTMDTESGFRDAVFVTSAYGLSEGVVQGAVNPDEFYVYKPALREGRPAVLKRGVGGKATKMIYTDDATVGRTTEFVDVDPKDSRLLSLTETHDSGEAGSVARFVAGTYDGEAFPFDLTLMRTVDVAIGDDMLACLDALCWHKADLHTLVPDGDWRLRAHRPMGSTDRPT